MVFKRRPLEMKLEFDDRRYALGDRIDLTVELSPNADVEIREGRVGPGMRAAVHPVGSTDGVCVVEPWNGADLIRLGGGRRCEHRIVRPQQRRVPSSPSEDYLAVLRLRQ